MLFDIPVGSINTVTPSLLHNRPNLVLLWYDEFLTLHRYWGSLSYIKLYFHEHSTFILTRCLNLSLKVKTSVFKPLCVFMTISTGGNVA